MSVEYSRGEINVSITFSVSSSNTPEQIAETIEKWISDKLGLDDFPYEEMSVVHLELDGEEMSYEDHEYEDYLNYIEDTKDRV